MEYTSKYLLKIVTFVKEKFNDTPPSIELKNGILKKRNYIIRSILREMRNEKEALIKKNKNLYKIINKSKLEYEKEVKEKNKTEGPGHFMINFYDNHLLN